MSYSSEQVLRVRSQVEIANRLGELSLHVGLLAEGLKGGERPLRLNADGPRFVWETVVLPGERSKVWR